MKRKQMDECESELWGEGVNKKVLVLRQGERNECDGQKEEIEIE
jgi:hypothetical protein